MIKKESYMRKPDLFDEILFFLKELSQNEPRVSVKRETLDELLNPPPRRKTPEDIPVYAPPQRGTQNVIPQAQTPATVKHIPNDCANTSWDELKNMVGSCVDCQLCQTRTNTVFGDGLESAGLMFIGEGPGADEDEQGLPFVGRAGELLTRMISAMTFDRWKEVYIANVVKCRPPNNRVPTPEEAAICKKYLERQIELVSPKVIVLLGATPLLYLLNIKGISKARGNWFDYKGIKVMPTYHPAYLLRDPTKKADTWYDLQLVMKEFGKKPLGR